MGKGFYMKLKISNFAKIKEADILVDGITVIAGQNNTGKSTIGKILFSLFNSITNIDERIEEQREREIDMVCRNFYRSYINQVAGRYSQRNIMVISHKITRGIAEKSKETDNITKEQISELIYASIVGVRNDQNLNNEFEENVDELISKIITILDVPKYEITLEVLTRYFSNVFCEQINSLLIANSKAEIDLIIKDKLTKLVFEENRCIEYNTEISILHNAIYINNPFIIDKLANYIERDVIDEHLVDLLTVENKNDVMDGVIESLLAKERFSKILLALQNVVKGKIVVKKDDEFFLEEEGIAKPIFLSNLSTGLKSFVLLKMLIERGGIKEKDVLVLDEPEVHLHPEWQLIYAEIIIMLQKEFDLSIVITTHSSHFLDSINYFAKKYNISDKCNFYLAHNREQEITFENVTNDLDKIYSEMVNPSILLDKLKYEIENEEDE